MLSYKQGTKYIVISYTQLIVRQRFARSLVHRYMIDPYESHVVDVKVEHLLNLSLGSVTIC